MKILLFIGLLSVFVFTQQRSSYSWEDETGTILGSYGNLANPANVGTPSGISPYDGSRMLTVSESPIDGTPRAYIAWVTDLSAGQMLFVEFGGEAVLLVNVEGSFYAVSEECTHSSCPLSDGVLEGKVVECRCHGAKFDVSTGNVLAPPADEPLTKYPIKITGEDILISSPT